jgi:hypothetical protein
MEPLGARTNQKGPTMTDPPGKQPGSAEREHDELELDKQTLQDLDVHEQDADQVKGGNSAVCFDTTDTKPPTTV